MPSGETSVWLAVTQTLKVLATPKSPLLKRTVTPMSPSYARVRLKLLQLSSADGLTFPYSLHWRCKYAGLSPHSGVPYDVEMICAGVTVPQSCPITFVST